MANSVQAFLEDGELRTDWVPLIADVKKPTVAELTAADSFNLGWYMPTDGFKLTHSQEMIDDDREAAAAAGQIPGQEKFTDGELTVIDNTNKGKDVENKAVETLTKGTTGFIVRRRGKGSDDPYVAEDVVSVYKVTIGIKTPVAHAANARQLSTISFSADPDSQDETATVSGEAAGTGSNPSEPATVAVTGVTLTPATASVVAGKTTQLTAAVAPDDAADKSVSFKSSEETIATVDDAGLVTGVAEGTATITVTTADGAKTATAEITVTPAEG